MTGVQTCALPILNPENFEAQKETSKTFEMMFEYGKEKENEVLSQVPVKQRSFFKIATNFAGEMEKNQN